MIMVVTLLLTGFASRSERIEPNRDFDEFPKALGNWQGQVDKLDPQVYRILGVDDSILLNFRSPDHRVVQLYVGFYQSQKEGDLIHSPKNCMPGAGWNIVESRVETIELPAAEKGSMDAILLKLKKGNRKQYVLYWFQSRGRIIASEYMQKIWLVVDSIIKRRTDGSFVRLISPVTGNEKKTIDTLKEFTRIVYPHLHMYIPS